MEDSYAAHRRRKAAARRHEKTPQVRLRTADGHHPKGEDTVSMEVEEERRARMERMVEDTERMEQMIDIKEDRLRSKTMEQQSEKSMPVQMVKTKATSPTVNRSEIIRQEDESESQKRPLTKKGELFLQAQEQKILLERHSSMRPIKKVSESKDGMDLRRRMSSPESSRNRMIRHPSYSPPINLNSPDNEKSCRRTIRKRISSRQNYDDASDEDESPVTVEHHIRTRSPSKLIKERRLPLNDNSLIENVAKAKWTYASGESFDNYDYDDCEREEEDEDYTPKRKRGSITCRRKSSSKKSDQEKERIRKNVDRSSSWFSWIPFFSGKTKQKVDEITTDNDGKKQKKIKKKERQTDEVLSEKEKLDKAALISSQQSSDKVTFRELLRSIRSINAEFREYCRQNSREAQKIIELRNLCIVETILVVVVCGLGGLVFRFTEGAFESYYKCGVKRVKRDFLDSLWNYSHNMREDDWKSMARRKLMEFEEQLHTAHEAGVQTYSGQRSWSFLNAMVYCLTIITTIGYGHISPSTATGRTLTILYAIFGIPMFLIVLADFGKLFTRGIKFLWAFVRRLYYTGSCRKVRRTAPMQEMMKGVQMVYDLATFRRASQMSPEDIAEMQRQPQTILSLDGNTPQQTESPSTPAMSTFEIDDEFNLPISVAITILVLYIFIGATVFSIFEGWSFFESFYFVFISMSTIGFGDFVPQDPLYMMLSIVYLIFGLALTSMCINVVQVMLAHQFKHASQKIGASIGFQVSDEDGSLKPAPPEPVEVADVHNPIEKSASATAADFKDDVMSETTLNDDEL